MNRMLTSAATPTTGPLVLLLVAAAFAMSTAPAVADVEVPLDTPISGQYQGAEAVGEVADVLPSQAVPASAPVPAAPPLPAQPELQYHPEVAPQQDSEEMPIEGEFVSHHRGGPTNAPAASPAPPAPVADAAPAPAPASKPAPAPAPAPKPAPPAPQPVPAADAPSPAPNDGDGDGGGNNINVSIRIFSPGDDGPVTQIVQGGRGATPPTTWKWSGPAGCDPGSGSNWTRSCNPAQPGNEQHGTGSLPDVESIPELVSIAGSWVLPDVASPPAAPPVALPGPAAAMPDRPLRPDRAPRAPRRASRSLHREVVPTTLAARRAPAVAWRSLAAPAPAAPAAASKPTLAPSKRRGTGGTTRPRRVIPAAPEPAAPAVAAASAVPGPAGSGGSPAMLAILICLSTSFLARAVLAAVGLPRLPLRGARRERPG
jgi:hypothetical protein